MRSVSKSTVQFSLYIYIHALLSLREPFVEGSKGQVRRWQTYMVCDIAEEMPTNAEERLSIKQKLPSCKFTEIPKVWLNAKFLPQLLTGDLLWRDLQLG